MGKFPWKISTEPIIGFEEEFLNQIFHFSFSDCRRNWKLGLFSSINNDDDVVVLSVAPNTNTPTHKTIKQIIVD